MYMLSNCIICGYTIGNKLTSSGEDLEWKGGVIWSSIHLHVLTTPLTSQQFKHSRQTQTPWINIKLKIVNSIVDKQIDHQTAQNKRTLTTVTGGAMRGTWVSWGELLASTVQGCGLGLETYQRLVSRKIVNVSVSGGRCLGLGHLRLVPKTNSGPSP